MRADDPRLEGQVAMLFAVRDAITAHLGADRARDLGIEVQTSSLRDVVEVRSPAVGFVITRKAMEQDGWRTTLAERLDALVQAAPAPSLPALVPMPFGDTPAAEPMAPCTIDEARAATLAHLGPRADEHLSFAYHAAADAVVVADTRSGRSFLVSPHTTAKGSWQGYLRECLDRLLPPSARAQDGIEQAAAGQEPIKPLASEHGS